MSPAGPPPPSFSVDRSDRGREILVALRGELDLAGVDDLLAAVEAVPPGARVMLELRELAFIDSSGIRAFMTLDTRARSEGWTLLLADPQDVVRRVLALCAFDDRVEILDRASES
jgi:anti-anti-sigma factor